MPRLFTAIDLPRNVRDQLAALSAPLPGAHWVPPENFHISLRFAGDIDPRRAREFADALAHIDHDVFALRIEGVGIFGGNDPRALWAGVGPSPALDALQRAHDRAARNAGLPPDNRAFKPHVTLARLRHARIDALTGFLEHHALLRSRTFVVERFALMSSRPQTGGGPYGIEENYPLRGASPDFGASDDDSDTLEH